MTQQYATETATLSYSFPSRPYPGLRPFEKSEWSIFFGRERMADEVITRIIRDRFLMVHGDSGCGKSSLIHAGVLPRLEQEADRGGFRWLTCAATPGEAPLWNLARALTGVCEAPEREDRLIEIRRALNFGRDGAAALARVLRLSANEHVCILLDQFEELFAYAKHANNHDASLLIEFLLGIQECRVAGVYAVLTMRSEFLGACAQYRGFAEAVNTTQYLLPRMEHADLMRAIREPACLYDGEVECELAERLIVDAGRAQDQLPLIQHALMLLHRDNVEPREEAASDHWRLELQHYTGSCAGLPQQLSAHANEVTEQALRNVVGNQSSRVVEDLFRALIDINAEGQAIRRPQRLEQLANVTGESIEVLRPLVDHFRVEGVSLLRPYGSSELAPDQCIDISHEALIRCWDKIADAKEGWLSREFRNGLVWRSLLVQADSFEREASNVLSPATTDERAIWIQRRNAAWCERYGGGWERVQQLLKASLAERDRIRIAKERARVRAVRDARKYRALFLAILVLAMGSTALAAYAVSLSKQLQERTAKQNETTDDAVDALTVAKEAKLQAEIALKSEKQATTRLTQVLDEVRILRDSMKLDGTKPEGSKHSLESTASALTTTLAQVNDIVGTKPLATGPKTTPTPMPMETSKAPQASSTGVPIEKVASARLSLLPTGQKVSGHDSYFVRIWIDLPRERLAEVRRVEYNFHHSSFGPQPIIGTSRERQFAYAYKGWGCVDADATLVGIKNDRHQIPFDMCALWGRARSDMPQ